LGAVTTEQRVPERRLVIFSVVSIALLMSSLDQTIVATALHALQHGLHASINWASWTITVYSVGLLLALPVVGRLSDRYGRRRIFLASAALFTAASLACGLAGNIYLLVVLRAVQAIGGAGFTPSATGIVVDHFGDARDKAVGLFGSIFPIGAILGPVLGGVFVTYWSWRGIFLVNVPVGITLILLSLRYIPRDAARGRAPGRFDLTGMALLGVGALAAMIAISYLGGEGAQARSPLFVVPVAAAVVALGLFVRHVGRTADAFIPARLLYGKGFGTVNVINMLFGGAAAGLGALIPLYAINRYGIDVLDSGLLLSARGAAVILCSSLAAFALRRTGYRRPMYVGFLLTGIGMLALSLAPIGLSAYAWLAVAAGVTGVGIGTANPATRNASLQLAPEQSATIASLRTMGRQTGSITAISVATAILAGSSNPGHAQAVVYGVFGLLLLAGLPLVARVPEHRGAW
jgi:EmrB/QacA subfamily drug resistance transporter